MFESKQGMNSERKPVLRSSDMPDDLQQDAIATAQQVGVGQPVGSLVLTSWH